MNTNNRFSLLLAVFLSWQINSFAQAPNGEQYLMTIGDSKITKSEFEAVYRKNNTIKTTDEVKSVNEYLELFINFKLKVKEAETLGLDTTKRFRDELAGYRRQLAQPYLTDKDVNEKLLKETYERLKEEICASHILIKCSEIASPKDTLIAYNRALKIYERIKKGESFERLASTKGISDDTSLVSRAGSIGCFTALDLVYSFETVAYNTPVGEVSKPVRTRFGYHIIKVNSRRKASGEVLVEHIMIKNLPRMAKQDSINQEKKINELYAKVMAGENFEKLAKEFSDDKQSAVNGGALPWFGINKLLPEFEAVAFALKNKGDIAKPIRTPYGMHIIKLIDKKQMGEFDEVKNELKQKLTKASRFSMGRSALINKLKLEYHFAEDKKALEVFYKLVDTNLFNAKWEPSAKVLLTQVLFSFADKTITQNDFANYIKSHQRKKAKADIHATVDELYKQFVDETIIKYEDEHLEQKYPDFKALMQEYRDGILLFELTDKKVWSKAIKDTAGLKKFYTDNQSKYIWSDQAEATIYTCSNKKVAADVRKMLKKGKTEEYIKNKINANSQLNLSVESKAYFKGDNSFVDGSWAEGVSADLTSASDNKIVIVHVKKIIKNKIKTLEEAKGAIISDYQTYLEQEWIAELKKKYIVVVDKNVLAGVKQ